ncbi:MAG TPA: transposase [Thermoanaerobaculia bacterium]|jgi:REP element-mobilizing transposase RayT|nr:transposase [Thermoanaerobaculia bacterium]
MARPPRLQAPGAIHHITARGNERRDIFRDDSDREDYIERIARYRARFGVRLYAFCLMPNHVHLALEQDPGSLSDFMHALQSSYTQAFNRRHERVGHLFQGRYKSFLVDSDRYFLALVRYIHENPVKAGIVREARSYPWSSDRFFRSGVGPPWLDLDSAFALLAQTRPEAMRRYADLMAHRAGAPAYETLTAYARSIKGDEEFAKEALRRASRPTGRSRTWTAESVARAIAICAGRTLDDLTGRSRCRNVARLRLISAYLGRERFGIPIAEAARLFLRDDSTLARRVRWLKEQIDREPRLKEQIEGMAKKAELPA